MDCKPSQHLKQATYKGNNIATGMGIKVAEGKKSAEIAILMPEAKQNRGKTGGIGKNLLDFAAFQRIVK
jgi:hypothetical protein